MNFIEQHKALIITFLLAGIVVFGLFSIQITQRQNLIAESYYLIETEVEKTPEELQELEDSNAKSSNKAFKEDEEFKEMMRNFKTVGTNDFERTTKAIEAAKASEIQDETSISKSYSGSNSYALNSEDTQSYKKMQEELKQRLNNKKQADEHAKTKSTLTYALKGRTLTHYKTPRYLCESGGKIVVSIKVDAQGNVFDAYINGSSNSNNQCLIDHALSYAESVQFDSSVKKQQLGTITFLFKGK